MKIPIPPWYDKVMDAIAVVVFPSAKYTSWTLGIYTLAIGTGLAFYFDNWLWIPAAIISMVAAWMLQEWLL